MEHRLDRLKILIVESNEIMRAGFSAILSEFTRMLLIHPHPREAEEIIQSHPDIDVVIMSMHTSPSPEMLSLIKKVHHPEARARSGLPADPMTYLMLIALDEHLEIQRPIEANPRYTRMMTWIGSVRSALRADIQHLAQHGRMPWDSQNI